MSIKEWIAEKLCPKAFADQSAYVRMKAEAADAYHWLGAYGDAADALRWLLDNDHNWRRAIGQPAIGSLPSSIDRFRDLLERRNVSPPLEKRPAAFEVLDTDEGIYLTRSEIAAQRTGFEYNGLYRRDSAEDALSRRALTEAQEQAQAALDKVMNCRFSNFDAGAVIHWAERGMYQLRVASPAPIKGEGANG